MIIANTKERLLYYLEFKGVSKSNFFEKTLIKRGFLDADKMAASVSDAFIAKIIASYSDLNIEWLVSGKGEMLRKEPFTYSLEQGGNEGHVSEPGNDKNSREKMKLMEMLEKCQSDKDALQARILELEKQLLTKENALKTKLGK